MLKSGMVAVQYWSLIHSKYDHHRRFSVVLYDYEMNGKRYVCTCPIIGDTKSVEKHTELYVPFKNHDREDKKNKFISIGDAQIYSEEMVEATDLVIDDDCLKEIIMRLNQYHPPLEKLGMFYCIRKEMNTIYFQMEEKKDKEKQYKRL